MKRYVIAAGAFALVSTACGLAQIQKTDPTQPGTKAKAKGRPGGFDQPGGFGQPGTQPGTWGSALTSRVTPARMASLEEDFETIEAHREVRKAYVMAAEVVVRSAEVNFDLISKSNPPKAEVEKARLEIDAAKAQLGIRMAEMKEVEVRLKYAKKRLDDAKAAGVRTPVRPAPVDPPPLRQAFGGAADLFP